MRVYIIAFVFWLAAVQGYAQTSKLFKFVDRYDICVFTTTKLIAETYSDSIKTLTVDSTFKKFDMVLKFYQPLGNTKLEDQPDPVYQGACSNPKILMLGEFQVADEQNNEINLIHNAQFVLGSGYWGYQIKAYKNSEASKWGNPRFFRVVYELSGMVPMQPVLIYFRVIE